MYQSELETKHAVDAKRGEACNRCQERENLQAVPSAGKHATGAKRGKTCKRCQARENVQAVPNQVTIVFSAFLFYLIGSITCHCSDWSKLVRLNFCYVNVCYLVPFKRKELTLRVHDHETMFKDINCSHLPYYTSVDL